MQAALNEEQQKLMKEILINGMPSGDLKECLGFYTKQKLADIAVRYGLTKLMSKKKEEIIDIISERILETLSEEIMYEDTSELEKLMDVCSDKETDTELKTITSLLRYRYQGWVYLFNIKNEDSICVVVPEQIKKYMVEFLSDKDKVIETNKNQEMLGFLMALNNMYGIYEIDQYLTVWNKYHEEQLSYDAFVEFFDKVKERYSFCWMDDNYIINEGFENKEEYQDLLNDVIHKPYYMPSKEDLEIYMQELVDIDSEQYIAIKNYLSKKVKSEVELDNLLYDLETICVLSALPSEVINFMEEYQVTFDDSNDANVFMKLYIDWQNNTRVWNNRGYKPTELYNDYNQGIVTQNVPYVRENKIGRNEPCPCGSGKKYKHCCGR
ncbi:SEC-C metal-binding domain-containing protein [Anaeromicropila herbilytica]|uniref:Zinc chelation protein SecC n=1 Tax=Anaeromicropila herbilytica TaxID=2785025 RepID=A0A7R7EIJ7_9FIRM|nr:SEC-C metal-binding domain-containing protein [Anaeromicropila herbilytica]BCN29427.1 zinc chelation protein SecC [Anaeromicropila herbilytica]